MQIDIKSVFYIEFNDVPKTNKFLSTKNFFIEFDLINSQLNSQLLIQVASFPACVHIWYKLCTFNFNFNFLPKYVSVAKALIVKAY